MTIVIATVLFVLFMFGFLVVLQTQQDIKQDFDIRDCFLLVIGLLLCTEQVYLIFKVFGGI